MTWAYKNSLTFIFCLLKIHQPVLFYAANIGTTETIKWEISPGMSHGCQNHDSCWICEPSSLAPSITFPTPHWISSLLWEFLHSGSGSAYGHGTELDWIGQWSHCKCITLTCPILRSYLQTESHYSFRSRTYYGCMYFLGVYRFENPAYEPYSCIIHR